MATRETLQRSIEYWREKHEAMFMETVAVTRDVAGDVFDRETGEYVEALDATVYIGPGQVREVRWQGTDQETGATEVRLVRSELRLPHDTPILEDDVLVVLTSENDSSLPDTLYRITDVVRDGWQVVRRAHLERIVER